MNNGLLLESSERARVVRKRTRRDPHPRFKPDVSHQLDAVRGCPAVWVPSEHLARSVWRLVSQLDTSALEARYSSLGRHGYHPRHVLAVWVYASLIGLHYSTKVAAAVATDAAFRLLSGGHAISAPTLRRFRQRNASFFASAIERTVQLASEMGLIDLEALAVDSVRIRAHASMTAVRTVARSTKRLAELSKVDESTLDETARETHRAKLEKHRAALDLCRQRDCTSVVLTNDAAALMKFPSGASAPGHRTTVVATGASSRFVIGVLVDADPTDHGKLGQAICKAREVLDRVGLRRTGQRLVAAADAGYGWEPDLQFAFENRDWVDLLVPHCKPGHYARFFGRDRFVVHSDRSAICPAGTKMLGPYSNSRKNRSALKWVGVGCQRCTLKPQCTDGKVRGLQIDLNRERSLQSAHCDCRTGLLIHRERHGISASVLAFGSNGPLRDPAERARLQHRPTHSRRARRTRASLRLVHHRAILSNSLSAPEPRRPREHRPSLDHKTPCALHNASADVRPRSRPHICARLRIRRRFPSRDPPCPGHDPTSRNILSPLSLRLGYAP